MTPIPLQLMMYIARLLFEIHPYIKYSIKYREFNLRTPEAVFGLKIYVEAMKNV